MTKALSIHSPSIALTHSVNGSNMLPPFPEGTQYAVFGLGCFWGAERLFWRLPGVYTTAVGYAGGRVRHPGYREVCSGSTGHIEVVLVVYQESLENGESLDAYADLLKVFWQSNDPTQGMRAGNDIGEQYQSAILCSSDEQYKMATHSRDVYQAAIHKTSGLENKMITTRIDKGGDFYYAEEYHQQYLAKNPDGYCSIKGLGIPYK